MPWFGSSGAGGGGGDVFVLDKFTAVLNQTVFNLSDTPASPATVLGFVNGAMYEEGTDFSIVGNVATWLNVDFHLSGGDKVAFFYRI